MDALLPGFFREAGKCLHSFAGSEYKLEAALILVWVILFQTKGDALYLDSKTERMMQTSDNVHTSKDNTIILNFSKSVSTVSSSSTETSRP